MSRQAEIRPAARLLELAGLFLKLGLTAFGGPAAHIGLMEHEFVRKRQWLTHEEFLDLLGATSLIPGPNSTELAIHIGLRRAGWAGLLVAGACFILPAAIMVTLIAWAYVTYGKLPQAEGLLYGVKPVIMAVVLQALWGLGHKAAKNVPLAILGSTGAVLSVIGVHELIILFGGGLAMSAWRRAGDFSKQALFLPPIFASGAGVPLVAAAAATTAAPFSLGALFLFFLKVGAVLFGSGYVLLAFLRADLVERWGWLTEGQLLDAIAVGQFTPGPLFTTATFIGYLLGNTPGALLATVGIFLPAFIFVALSGPLIPKLRASPAAAAFLDGVNAASLALMAVVTAQLGAGALVDWPTVALAAVAGVLLLRFKINSAWLVLGGGAMGWALKSL